MPKNVWIRWIRIRIRNPGLRNHVHNMIAIEFSVDVLGHPEPGVAQEAGAGVPLRGAPAHSVQGLRQGLRQRGPPGMDSLTR